MKKEKLKRVLVVGILFLFGIGIVTNIILLKLEIDEIGNAAIPSYNEYSRHYAFISESADGQMQQTLFNGAYNYGIDNDALVEWLGKSLDTTFEIDELMKMALNLNVDGIILDANDTEKMRELIDEADKRNIPVVTVLNDCYNSTRKSYVGISNYNLGREYGREIIKFATKDSREILILGDSSIDENSQSVVLNGIKETLNNEGNHLKLELKMIEIDGSGAFSAEREIRELLKNMESYPDAIIALSQQNTNSLIQAVVDRNIVGEMEILGFYTSKSILEEVSKNVLTSTIYVDFASMGKTSVEALNEYLDTGFVSDFFLIDSDTVNIQNVEDYLEDEK